MRLVLFEDALDHLTRIHRVLRIPQGHALLVGVGGSGKQSISRLAAYTADCGVFEITLCRGYNEASMRDDLKVLYTKLGLENKRLVFLFSDQHVVEEGMSSCLHGTAECISFIRARGAFDKYNVLVYENKTIRKEKKNTWTTQRI